ncbi:hypothetical protein EYF80_033312 [Liparis tanakae]|uniref:Uncharacterized protein n=1 Tax=Liparis tanakae TaxID=230148 RepID=A0A4Z2GUP0_9TELE|nr:hypothetical protein EYF80_033312 [Liparis tanakae]
MKEMKGGGGEERRRGEEARRQTRRDGNKNKQGPRRIRRFLLKIADHREAIQESKRRFGLTVSRCLPPINKDIGHGRKAASSSCQAVRVRATACFRVQIPPVSGRLLQRANAESAAEPRPPDRSPSWLPVSGRDPPRGDISHFHDNDG